MIGTKAQRRRIVTASAFALMAAGCVHPQGPKVVTDPDPSVKIPATAKAVRNHDLSAVPQLIKDLQSDDPAVRLYAAHGLEQLTGQDLGYRYYAADDDRLAAVARWQQWYDQQSQQPTQQDPAYASGKARGQSTTAATQLP